MSSDTPFKSGFVAVVGRPNVGKSTLVNLLLGQKVAAVSPRPQTTRRRQLGILTQPAVQVIFIDTPGLHKPLHKLGEKMNQQAQEALEDSDLILFIVDASQAPTSDDQRLAELIATVEAQTRTILLLNKCDLATPDQMAEHRKAFQKLIPEAECLLISATHGDHCGQLLEWIIERLPKGPEYFPEDQITDLYERDIAADLIREAALIHLREEVPHGIAVRINEYTERGEHDAYISATLFIERESHKPIVIGQNGKMLKKIGTSARQEIEAMSGRKTYLELRVKVRKNWRDDEKALHSLGLDE